MRESVGSVTLYNIVIVFLSIIFGLIVTTLIYYKAFKVNKVIVSSLEKFEGYNSLAINEINMKLNEIGFSPNNRGCPARDGVEASTPLSDYGYCVYYYPKDTADGSDHYYSYGVMTYISFDIPMFRTSAFSIPIYTKTDRIYRFGSY